MKKGIIKRVGHQFKRAYSFGGEVIFSFQDNEKLPFRKDSLRVNGQGKGAGTLMPQKGDFDAVRIDHLSKES